MPMNYDKPLPEIGDMNRPFWEATRNGALKMQKCASCGHIRYPISHICPECLSEDYDWATLSGRGTVFSTVVFHQVYHKGFREEVPYNVSLVQLDEGTRMFSNVVGVPPSDVQVGQKVEAVFAPVPEAITLPRFRPKIGRESCRERG